MQEETACFYCEQYLTIEDPELISSVFLSSLLYSWISYDFTEEEIKDLVEQKTYITLYEPSDDEIISLFGTNIFYQLQIKTNEVYKYTTTCIKMN